MQWNSFETVAIFLWFSEVHTCVSWFISMMIGMEWIKSFVEHMYDSATNMFLFVSDAECDSLVPVYRYILSDFIFNTTLFRGL